MAPFDPNARPNAKNAAAAPKSIAAASTATGDALGHVSKSASTALDHH
jgi:hypothetical protein